MKPSEILKGGLKLLEEKGWTQLVYARNAKGDDCSEPSQLVCFCGLGAIRFAAFQRVINIPLNDIGLDINYLCARRLLGKAAGAEGWADWQDRAGRKFWEVKAKYLEAIALAEAEELLAA